MKWIGSILLILLLSIATCSTAAAYPYGTGDATVQSGLDYIRSCQHDDGGFAEEGRDTNPGTSWFAVMAIVAAGEDPHNWRVNGTSAIDYWKTAPDATNPEGTAELGKMITLITAAGENPRAFNNHNYVAELKARMKTDGQFGDFVYTTYWGVLGLASAGEDVSLPAAWLKKQQNKDGGYGWMPGAESDSDDTAAVIMALIAAGEPVDTPAVARAIDYLRAHQMSDGSFNYGGTSSSNAASAAWVIQAIVAVGEDPSSWSKNSNNLITTFADLQQPDGSFFWTTYSADNPCGMTARAIPALLGKPYLILPGQAVPALPGQGQPVVAAPETTTVAQYQATLSAADPATWQPVTIIDDYGETVRLDTMPVRIVSLAPANTEILFALGLGDRVVGVTDYCNYPEEATTKPKVGGYSTVNIERVVAAQPDLVVGAFGNTEEAINRLKSLGLTVITLSPDSVEGTLHDIRLTGKATDTEVEAERLAASMEARIDAVQEKTKSVTRPPTVAHVIWYDPIWVSGSITFQDELITLAGGTNAFPELEGWQIVSLERFITTDPEVIVVNSGTGMGSEGVDLIYRYFMNEPRLKTMKAIQQNRVYIIESDLIDRGGPRLVDALEEVAADIHSDLFEGGTQNEASIPQSPGFGVIPLAFAFLAVLLIR
ncbi:MAG: helical backbone metal receptor, partial [Methanoculleus sp.]